ncbi:hypothetical protein WISP_110569 [Willisornis vidua]|uniref:Uncharacterized protein n=1 Tax=Willisornis vidua TaxID=1566151 RepID=A0ABQ9CVR0_9PASS|nr:hypothetical protein WISP_110569 [Willisornis vidua]
MLQLMDQHSLVPQQTTTVLRAQEDTALFSFAPQVFGLLPLCLTPQLPGSLTGHAMLSHHMSRSPIEGMLSPDQQGCTAAQHTGVGHPVEGIKDENADPLLVVLLYVLQATS